MLNCNKQLCWTKYLQRFSSVRTFPLSTVKAVFVCWCVTTDWIQDCIVGVVTGLRTGRLAVRIPARARDFFPNRPHRYWGPPIPLFSRYRSSSSGGAGGVKQPGRDIDYSPSSAEVRNKWMSTSTPHMCFHGVDRDNFSLCYRSIDIVPVINGRR